MKYVLTFFVAMAIGSIVTLPVCAVVNSFQPVYEIPADAERVEYDWTPEAPYHDAVVSILSGTIHGSGAYVQYKDFQFILTAAHVVASDNVNAIVTFRDGRAFNGSPVSDKFYTGEPLHQADVAAILLDREVHGVEPLKIEPIDEDFAIVGEVEVCGFGGPGYLDDNGELIPFHKKFRHFTARVIERTYNGVMCDARVSGGDSGGPWIDDGNVIGVSSTGDDRFTLDSVVIEGTKPSKVYIGASSPDTKTLNAFVDRLHDVHCQAPG